MNYVKRLYISAPRKQKGKNKKIPCERPLLAGKTKGIPGPTEPHKKEKNEKLKHERCHLEL